MHVSWIDRYTWNIFLAKFYHKISSWRRYMVNMIRNLSRHFLGTQIFGFPCAWNKRLLWKCSDEIKNTMRIAIKFPRKGLWRCSVKFLMQDISCILNLMYFKTINEMKIRRFHISHDQYQILLQIWYLMFSNSIRHDGETQMK